MNAINQLKDFDSLRKEGDVWSYPAKRVKSTENAHLIQRGAIGKSVKAPVDVLI